MKKLIFSLFPSVLVYSGIWMSVRTGSVRINDQTGDGSRDLQNRLPSGTQAVDTPARTILAQADTRALPGGGMGTLPRIRICVK